MRDYIVILVVFGSLPLILRKPVFGILIWTWLSLMNPHRLCWGVAVNMPFAQIVAITLLGSLLLSKEPKRIPWVGLTKLLALWWAWMLLTTFFALNPDDAWEQWSKVWRIMLLTFIAVMLLNSRVRLEAMVWTIVISLGAYGVKGGIFTLITGGGHHVQGPVGSFISGNNEIGLALIMTVPLMRYLQLTATSKAVKNGMIAAMGLTVMAILGTQSRGALVGLAAMFLYLALKSRNRTRLMAVLILILPAAFMFMPDTYFDRMETIETYEEDASALGRINAWWTAWYIALDRPLIGGGFEAFRPWVFVRYAPDPTRYHDVHSIYFEALGEHGFVGLALFLGIGATALLALGRIARRAAQRTDLVWMRDMASMIYVSLIGYAVSGAFLGLAYFDYYYALIAMAIGLVRLSKEQAFANVTSPVVAAELPTASKAPRRGPRAGLGVPKKPLFGLDFRGWFSRL
jgi:probable O-glycosylation ligase (exosortase A-associated)